MSDAYTISELAEEFAITPRTIRFYEDKRLIAPRREGLSRIFCNGDRVRLKLILRGKRLGFSLADIKEMLSLYDADPDHVAQLKVALGKGRARINDLERQRRDIDAALAELRAIGGDIEDRLRKKGVDADAP